MSDEKKERNEVEIFLNQKNQIVLYINTVKTSVYALSVLDCERLTGEIMKALAMQRDEAAAILARIETGPDTLPDYPPQESVKH